MKILIVCVIFLQFVCIKAFSGTRKSNGTLSLPSYFDDHMVLQKAPAYASIWGYSTIGDDVIVVSLLDTGARVVQFSATVVYIGPENKAVWKVFLEPVKAGGPYSVVVESDHGSALTINDVLFGDVWVCSGQSNMQFTLPMAYNGSKEVAEAAAYPDIRLFTASLKTADTPQYDFISVEETWSVASPSSVGNGNWTYFSAVCYLYGKDLYQKLKYPIGLVASDWGGTAIEVWSSPDALKKCQIKDNSTTKSDLNVAPTAHSVLWNAMIHPFLNYTIYGTIWYQGELNSGNPLGYNCSFPAMIDDWRLKFSESNPQTSSSFPFGFVQLAPRLNDSSITTGYPDIRWSQTAGYGTVPNPRMKDVFMALAMDLPDFTSPFQSVHPRDKETVASRLTLSGLAVAYGKVEKFQGPYPSDVKFSQGNKQLTITYDMGLTNIEVRSAKGFEFCCSSSQDKTVCDQPSLNSWFPVTTLASTPTTLILDVPASCTNQHILLIRYAWRESPCPYKQCAVYSVVNELPGPPFKISLIV
ncbi:sialate O-acetylesterase isoform X1 [Patella vulgata]|uniref:sialate O-acetylesterase isoform X1 n=1 Tax=Patella vulgata TaxID=6465 RepID=UPI00217FEECD|nr:sialate O-acetylesterase isoform X1 [Patella vulgata]